MAGKNKGGREAKKPKQDKKPKAGVPTIASKIESSKNSK